MDTELFEHIKTRIIQDIDIKKAMYDYGVDRALHDENFKHSMAKDSLNRSHQIYLALVGKKIISILLILLGLLSPLIFEYLRTKIIVNVIVK